MRMTPAEQLDNLAITQEVARGAHEANKEFRRLEVRITELEAQNAILREALEAAEKADEAVCNCEEHEPEMAPETCEWCFPVVDDARIKRWIALGKLPAERRNELIDMQRETQTRKE